MAESQGSIVYDEALVGALQRALSIPRLAPYLSAANGDWRLAINLYLWNCRLSKAFLYPLNLAEIATRNAMHRALSAEFGGEDWIIRTPFALTAESEASRRKAFSRLPRTASPDDLVAALTFDFWSNLFRREYNSIWNRPGLLSAAFTHLPADKGRGSVQSLVARVNNLRNRIAHHEPIHTLNHRASLDDILSLLAWNEPLVGDWVGRCCTVMAVARTPPSAKGGRPGLPLSSTNLHRPLLIDPEDTVLSTMEAMATARPAIGLIPADPIAATIALAPAHLMEFVAMKAREGNGLVDLAEHRVAQVLATTTPLVVSTIDRDCSSGDAIETFFPRSTPRHRRPQVLLVTSGAEIVGVLQNPGVRYG